jgi:hypothetical protein
VVSINENQFSPQSLTCEYEQFISIADHYDRIHGEFASIARSNPLQELKNMRHYSTCVRWWRSSSSVRTREGFLMHRFVALAITALLTGDAHAQDCFSVQPAPFAGSLGAVRLTSNSSPGDIRDAIVHDFDGPGPLPERLFITGAFTHVGGIFANGIAAFDGDRWIPLEAGLSISLDSSNNAGGSALVIHENELVIGGTFPALGGNQAFDKRVGGIVRWNGMTLEPSYQSNASTGPSTSFNSVFSLASAHGVVYFAGPSASINNVPGVGSILYGGVLTRNGFARLPVEHSEIASIFTVGNEVMYRGNNGIAAWNGRDARIIPLPSSLNSASFFPYCGITDGPGFILGGDYFGELNPGILSIGTLRWNQSWLDLPGMPSPSLPNGPSRVTIVDSFSRRDNSIFAFTWPGFSQRSPMQRLVNNQWVDQAILYSGFTPTNNHIRGEITFQNRRFLYGKINTVPATSSARITLQDPANLIAEVDATNRVVPMNGLYTTHAPSSASTYPSIFADNQLVVGGPLGFAFGGTRALYVAGWDGTQWNRVAENDLVEPPVDLAMHEGQLHALGTNSLPGSNWELLRRGPDGRWAPVTSQTFTGRARLHSHQGSLYLFTSATSGPNAFRLVNSTLTPLSNVATNTGSSRTFTALSIGSDLYFTAGTALQRLSGTTWQTIPLPTGALSYAAIATYQGSLHAVDITGTGNTQTLRIHRLDANIWTPVSSLTQFFGPTTAALEYNGDLFILNNVGLLRFSPVTGWTIFPITGWSSVQFLNLLVGPNGSLYITGSFTLLNNHLSHGVAIFAPTPITVNWPPLPRHGVRGSIISLGVGATGQFSSDAGLTYQWQRNDQPLVNGVTTNGTTIIGATSRRLVLNNAQPADAGLYRVRIALACGTNFTTEPVPVTISTCNDTDFNNNQVFPEDQDVIDFFDTLAGAPCAGCDSIDFNSNQVFPEDQDVIDFFRVLAGGSCP